MSIIEAFVLGLVQGLTEFIPVSSSGHLLLVHEIFGTSENSLAFDVALHTGTLLALLLFFRKDIWRLASNLFSNNKDGRLARLLFYGTLPAAVAGFLFSDFIDNNARTTATVAISLGLFGLIMLWSERFAAKRSTEEVSMKQGLIIGISQVLALVPGVSRSGSTMTAGFFVGLGRKQAARFSFLLAIPIIAGSAFGILLKDSSAINFDFSLLVGMTTAFISGLIAIKFMLNVIARVGLMPFAYYRIILSIFIIVLTFAL